MAVKTKTVASNESIFYSHLYKITNYLTFLVVVMHKGFILALNRPCCTQITVLGIFCSCRYTWNVLYENSELGTGKSCFLFRLDRG